DRLRVGRVGCRTADILSLQPTFRPVDRTGGGVAVWNLVRRDQLFAPPGAHDRERCLMLRCLVALAVLLSAHPAQAADRLMMVATFSVIGDMLANVGG